jgi:hypothetical protein
MAVFWVVAPCSPVKIYRRFRDACSTRLNGATTQKTTMFQPFDCPHVQLNSRLQSSLSDIFPLSLVEQSVTSRDVFRAIRSST